MARHSHVRLRTRLPWETQDEAPRGFSRTTRGRGRRGLAENRRLGCCLHTVVPKRRGGQHPGRARAAERREPSRTQGPRGPGQLKSQSRTVETWVLGSAMQDSDRPRPTPTRNPTKTGVRFPAGDASPGDESHGSPFTLARCREARAAGGQTADAAGRAALPVPSPTRACSSGIFPLGRAVTES